jgi:hypothetical protein
MKQVTPETLAAALLSSGLIARLSDYAVRAHPLTMKREGSRAIADSWAKDIYAALPDQPDALDFDAMRVAREWPTPMAMRDAADGLDHLAIPKYGDILRWVADRCDAWVWHLGDPAAAERLDSARAALATSAVAGEGGEAT